ncbi:MAG: glutamine--fructose-6-phosphate transaminase (isomerizing) [Parvularculaceae bacterium]
MCGIIGVVGRDGAADAILEGLKRLEYRGYDSAGVATSVGGRIERVRAVGKLSNLAERLNETPLAGSLGIGHTRWATHGAATEINAHPHATPRLALVHNGIIENFADLRGELSEAGRAFESQTDTEVVAQLITHYLETDNLSPKDATAKALARLRGAFALAVIFEGDAALINVARRGGPLAIGRGEGETFVGSDAYALAPFTNKITYLEEGDWACVRRDGFEIYDGAGAPASRPEKISAVSANIADKDGHRHFMAKEIHEQPEVIAHTLSRYIDATAGAVRLPEEGAGGIDFASIDRLTISACGTAFYAGLTSKYWFERWARLPIEIDVASELRYRDPPYTNKGAALFISQSGETADTLAALRSAKEAGQRIAAVVNVPESSIAREADVVLPIAAGPEIGVASTKAFTCQLAALACIAIAAGRARGVLSAAKERELAENLLAPPRLVAEALKAAPDIEETARDIAQSRDALYIGRGVSFPLALEGALKLKEISYIHAEGYAAGELKHGPIALIEADTPVIIIAPSDAHYEKTISNMHEVIAREGKALLISDADGAKGAGEEVWRVIEAPRTHPMLTPIVYSVPIQLLAYFTATAKGTDVDQPRNLAKSVTVE